MPGPFTPADFLIELSTDGSTFTGYSIDAVSVTPGGGERNRGSLNTAGRDLPYFTVGKRQIVTYTVRVVYKNASTDFAMVVRALFLATTQCWIRYSPEGGASGDNRTTVGPGWIVSCPPPPGDAGSGEPLAFEFNFEGEGETDDTVP